MNQFLYGILTSFIFLFTSCNDGDGDGPRLYRYESSLHSKGVERTYVVKLPSEYYESPSVSYPLVIALHGTGGSAVQMERTYGLNEKGDSSNFIVVYPEGVRSGGRLQLRTWNAGICCDYAYQQNINDVEFIRQVIDQVQQDFRINSRKVYITGMSNGGMLAYTLACELSSKIAAIAPISASMMRDKPCNPERTVPVLHIHSTRDTKVPYNGGIGIGDYYFPPVDSVLSSLAATGICTVPSRVVDTSQFVRTVWNDCKNGAVIESYVTHDGGHSWPGGLQPGPWADPPSAYINANDLMWDFFQRFELP